MREWAGTVAGTALSAVPERGTGDERGYKRRFCVIFSAHFSEMDQGLHGAFVVQPG